MIKIYDFLCFYAFYLIFIINNFLKSKNKIKYDLTLFILSKIALFSIPKCWKLYLN